MYTELKTSLFSFIRHWFSGSIFSRSLISRKPKVHKFYTSPTLDPPPFCYKLELYDLQGFNIV